VVSHNGLELVPEAILSQGSKTIVEYILDLYRSPDGESLYRSKIMTVGFESVGKTSLLDCLFPMEGRLFVKEGLKRERREYYFTLQGKHLSKYRAPNLGEPLEVIVIEQLEWSVKEFAEEDYAPLFGNERRRFFSFGLIPTPKHWNRFQRELVFFCESKQELETWLARLKRVCMNLATHGIEIQNVTIPNPFSQGTNLEISVWDLAGQLEYYQNHHYFISIRTVFLAIWRLDLEEKGLKGLEFWLRSLSFHIPPQDPFAGTNYCSIIIIGTFLDQVEPSKVKEREEKANKVALQCGFFLESIQYYEVSCTKLTNVQKLRDSLIQTVFSHSYMGEKVPRSYFIVEQAVKELRGQNREVPLVDVSEIKEHCSPKLMFELETLKRALKLLTLWGECVYFEHPKELSSIVILDPRFLTKEILAQLFRPREVSFLNGGIVKHSDLPYVWTSFAGRKNFNSLAMKLISLMQKLEVCFTLDPEELPFMQQRSLIPSLLPSLRSSRSSPSPLEAHKRELLGRIWPKDPPFERPVQLERILKFNVIPVELVSRLMVRLHPLIQQGLIWSDDVIVYDAKSQTQGRIQVDYASAWFVVTLRCSDPAKGAALLEKVMDEVKSFLVLTPGVMMKEQVRSPHDQYSSLDLVDIETEILKEEEKRDLCCPFSLLPIHPEKILVTRSQVKGSQADLFGAFLSLSLFFLKNQSLTLQSFFCYHAKPKRKDIMHGIFPCSDAS